MNTKVLLDKLKKDQTALLKIKKQLQKMDEQIDRIIEDPESILKN